MPLKPRLIDMLPDKVGSVTLTPLGSRRRRPLVTQDGTTIPPAKPGRPIVHGESYPIAGTPLAMDARPKPSRQAVTFDGAVPSPKT